MAVTSDSAKPADEKYSKTLKLMVDEPTNYKNIMSFAASEGRIEIVKLMLMLEKGANDYNWAMRCAASEGHMDIVKLLLEKGAYGYCWAMTSAASGGHMDIVKLMLEKGANNYNGTMYNAANNGHIDIVKLMLEKGANDYNWTMRSAASEGHMDIVKLMLEKGANDYNQAMYSAAKSGAIDIVKLMLEKGANDYKSAVDLAESSGYMDIVTLLKEHQKNKLSTTKEPEIATENEKEKNKLSTTKEPKIATENEKVAKSVLEIIQNYKPSIEHITEYARCVAIIEKIPPNEVHIVVWQAVLKDRQNNGWLNYDYLMNLMGCIYNAYPKNEEIVLFCKFRDDVTELLLRNRCYFNVNNKLYDLMENPQRFPPKKNVSNRLSLMTKTIYDMVINGRKPEEIVAIINCVTYIY